MWNLYRSKRMQKVNVKIEQKNVANCAACVASFWYNQGQECKCVLTMKRLEKPFVEIAKDCPFLGENAKDCVEV